MKQFLPQSCSYLRGTVATTNLVTATNSTRNKSLWDLPENVQRSLLVLCASGDEGLATLLNLRLTCRWTKNLVDETPPNLQATLFSSAIVRLDFSNLDEFTESCPQLPMVTSLYISSLHSPTHSHTSELLFEFWKDRLLDLKIHTLTMPVEDANLSRLLSLPTLKTLECHTLRWKEPYSPFNSLTMGHIPSFTRSSVTSLTIRNLRATPTETLKFYLELLAVPALKDIHLWPETPNDLFTLARLVHQRRNETSFSLTLSLKKCRFNVEIRDSAEWELMRMFAHTVTSSLSKIVLQDVPALLLDLVVIPEESPVASEFFRRVESLNEVTRLSLLTRTITFDDLPAIKSLDGLCVTLETLEFPPTLETLNIHPWEDDVMRRRIKRQGTFVLSAFPPALRSLTIMVGRLTAEEYPLFMSTLAAECPSLELLDISRIPEGFDLKGHKSGEGDGDGIHPFQRMRRLKFLQMHMHFQRRDNPELLGPFFELLASLPLEVLIVVTNPEPSFIVKRRPMIREVAGILCSGIIARSLLTVKIKGIGGWKTGNESEQNVSETAELENLWKIVCGNRETRELKGSLPRRRLKYFDIDPDDLRNWLHVSQHRNAFWRAVRVE